MSDADLKARIQEDELRLKKLEFAHAISPLENPDEHPQPPQRCCAPEN